MENTIKITPQWVQDYPILAKGHPLFFRYMLYTIKNKQVCINSEWKRNTPGELTDALIYIQRENKLYFGVIHHYLEYK
jgi:hypothetical protein